VVRKGYCIYFVWGMCIFLTGLLSACTGSLAPARTPTTEGAHTVDPKVRELYDLLGGAEVLGPAISALQGIPTSSKECQYFEAALLCFDANAPAAERNTLYPLGKLMNQIDPAGVVAPGSSQFVVDGYEVFAEFVPLYRKLYEARYVGKPLTNPRYNHIYKRYEQYFENVGFYRRYEDPPGMVHLLAYGATSCDVNCRYRPQDISGAVDRSQNNEQLFFLAINRWGGERDVGQPLSGVFTATDGNQEQIYQTIALYAPAGQIDQARLRPLGILLKMPTTPPEAPKNDTRVVFYPVKDGLGYHVPVEFDQFIATHGGREISGAPISGLLLNREERAWRQCFENYCLDYPQDSPNASVRMAPLGLLYAMSDAVDSKVLTSFIYSKKTVSCSLTTERAQVRNDEQQIVQVMVTNQKDGQPLSGFGGTVTVNLPAGTRTYLLPPTDAQGKSQVTVDAATGAQNSQLIAYEACLNTPSQEKLCYQNAYMIWNVP